MARMVKCTKLGSELPGMIYKPFLNELGQRIYDNISQAAWGEWIEYSKKLVNEYRIDMVSPDGQRKLLDEAEKFFFGAGGQLPPDYVPPEIKG